MSPLELAPYARAGLRRARIVQLALAAILGGLALLVVAILLAVTLAGAARPEDGVPIIAGITFVVAGLPALLLLKLGLPHESRHVLVRVLEQHPEKVRAVAFSYRADDARAARVAHVTLTDGSTWDVEVPAEEVLARAPRRAGRGARSERAMTSFSGDFVRLPDAWTGLEGAGTIEVTDAALVVVGARVRMRLAKSLGVLTGLVAGTLGLFFLVTVELPWVDDPRLPAVVVILLALAGYAGTVALLVRALPRAELRIAVPWHCVQDVRAAGVFVDLQSIDPALTGLSRFRTDRPELLVAACRS